MAKENKQNKKMEETKLKNKTDRLVEDFVASLEKLEKEANISFKGVSLIRQAKDDSWNVGVFNNE